MTTLRKGDLALKVAEKLGSPKSQGDMALNAVLDCIREALASGDRVVVTGSGAFESRKVKDIEKQYTSTNVFDSVKSEFEAIAGIVEQSGTWEEV